MEFVLDTRLSANHSVHRGWFAKVAPVKHASFLRHVASKIPNATTALLAKYVTEENAQLSVTAIVTVQVVFA
jgi:predicted ThiF/HesA family dinucleotide-utilizing enzyme